MNFKVLIRRSLLALLFVFSTSLAGYANGGFSSETLKYVISYKWGIIHKDAGEAVLHSHLSGDKYQFTLTAKTKPWADRVFKVRDTLSATVSATKFRPLKYVKSAHEGDRYARDIIKFSYTGSRVMGQCQRFRDKKGKQSDSSLSLSADAPAFDMLSVFYWLRTIDLAALTKEKTRKVTIFSGSKAETLTIRMIGEEDVKLKGGSRTKAWHLKFNFTTAGRKKSSDDIDCWLSADGRKIPLLLVGTLPVGQVKCYYIG